MRERKEIKICSNHEEYKVPLIWTFKFIGCEYWCPYCGYAGGMFGSGENVTATPTLNERLRIYKEAAKQFLSTDSMDWEYEVKATKLLNSTPKVKASVATGDDSKTNPD